MSRKLSGAKLIVVWKLAWKSRVHLQPQTKPAKLEPILEMRICVGTLASVIATCHIIVIMQKRSLKFYR